MNSRVIEEIVEISVDEMLDKLLRPGKKGKRRLPKSSTKPASTIYAYHGRACIAQFGTEVNWMEVVGGEATKQTVWLLPGEAVQWDTSRNFTTSEPVLCLTGALP